MPGLFDRVMRVLSTLLGLLVTALGGIWILQGLKIAFLNSPMAGQPIWVFYGALLAAVGVAQIVWTNFRPR